MNVQFLIDAIVRQTTVLIAQLATSGGVRAPLAHVANQVFLDLAGELEEQGVGRKVSADMFGLALRSYRRKIQRLRESSTDRGRSLWRAVVSFLADEEVASLGEVLERFHRDDENLVRGVLHDLTESGLAFRSGSGWSTIYRMTTDEDLSHLHGYDADGMDNLVWITVYRTGLMAREDLVGLGGLDEDEVDASLTRLVQSGRVVERQLDNGSSAYECEEVVVELGAPSGWEAAVFDHFQAMVRTVTGRLQRQPARTDLEDVVGGSTYTLDVWTGHPMYTEVLGTLRRLRDEIGDLRGRVETWNTNNPRPDAMESVTLYFGQCISESEPDVD